MIIITVGERIFIAEVSYPFSILRASLNKRNMDYLSTWLFYTVLFLRPSRRVSEKARQFQNKQISSGNPVVFILSLLYQNFLHS